MAFYAFYWSNQGIRACPALQKLGPRRAPRNTLSPVRHLGPLGGARLACVSAEERVGKVGARWWGGGTSGSWQFWVANKWWAVSASAVQDASVCGIQAPPPTAAVLGSLAVHLSDKARMPVDADSRHAIAHRFTHHPSNPAVAVLLCCHLGCCGAACEATPYLAARARGGRWQSPRLVSSSRQCLRGTPVLAPLASAGRLAASLDRRSRRRRGRSGRRAAAKASGARARAHGCLVARGEMCCGLVTPRGCVQRRQG